MFRPVRFLTAALTLAAGAAAAHTGHGHDTLSVVQGLRHALAEPDHLLMLAFGFGAATLAAPRLLGALQRLLRAWRSGRAAAHDSMRQDPPLAR